MNDTPTYWALVPAAGIGSRFQSRQPKQYASLGEQTVLELSIARLLSVPRIHRVIVILHPQDTTWPHLAIAANPRVETVTGDSERHLSVLRGLNALTQRAQANDWVLVHDAVRPCVMPSDIDHLLEATAGHTVGGLLGVPINDTLKRVTVGQEVSTTVARDGLWAAQTPQVFRYALLQQALQAQVNAGASVTDESMAIELQGYEPLMVMGHRDNIKITQPQDLALAKLFLQQQSQQ